MQLAARFRRVYALENSSTSGSNVNGHGHGHTNGHSNGHGNGYSNGHGNGHRNGHRNGSNFEKRIPTGDVVSVSTQCLTLSSKTPMASTC